MGQNFTVLQGTRETSDQHELPQKLMLKFPEAMKG